MPLSISKFEIITEYIALWELGFNHPSVWRRLSKPLKGGQIDLSNKDSRFWHIYGGQISI